MDWLCIHKRFSMGVYLDRMAILSIMHHHVMTQKGES